MRVRLLDQQQPLNLILVVEEPAVARWLRVQKGRRGALAVVVVVMEVAVAVVMVMVMAVAVMVAVAVVMAVVGMLVVMGTMGMPRWRFVGIQVNKR